MEIREVEFMGDTLLTVKNDDNKVYVGIRWICQGLGLNDNQRKHQISRVQSDYVLSQGVRKIFLVTNKGDQEVICLDITYLPLWLAKINVNIVKDEIQGKLVEYQLRAKDCLANAFLPLINPQVNPSIPQLPSTYQEALRMLADSMDTIVVNAPKVKAFDRFMDANGLQSISQTAKALGTGRDRLFRFLREQGIIMKNNEPYQPYVTSGYFEVIETVRHGFINVRTMVTPKGVGFIEKLLHPIESMDDIQRIVKRIQG